MVRPLENVVIAVDGPSGSGKSSTSRGVAQRLGLRYLDTGSLYRAVAWWMKEQGIDLHDRAAVAAAVHRPVISAGTDPAGPQIHVDGIDVGKAIRTPEVTAASSLVSAVPEVRARLLTIQREHIADGGIVVEGRDIGTTVVPDADVKIFLDARSEVRAGRRAEQRAKGGTIEEQELARIEAAMAARDERDAGREVSPLAMAADAHEIDGSHSTLEEVIDEVIGYVREVTG